VELHGLTGGQSNGVVSDVARGAIERQPLIGRESSAGDRDANHENMVEFFFVHGALSAHVTIVLGVDAMELEDLLGFVGHTGDVVVEFTADCSAQVVT
jgi:hypothetical protein